MTGGLYGRTFPGPKLAGVLLAMLTLTAAGLPRAAAGDSETRDFTIFVDGKTAGEYHLTIADRDGRTEAQADAKVQLKFLIKTYRYTYSGHEVWKDGRLLKLDSQANDDGTEMTVHASAENDGLRVRCKGGERVTRSDVWATTYWHQPDNKFVNQNVPLLDSDTGEDIAARLTYVGQNEINVNGENQRCHRYLIRGGKTVDLWYDGKGRLVRQESIEDGYRTILQLTAIHP